MNQKSATATIEAGVSGIGTKFGLSYPDTVFVCLVTLGITAKDAYLATRPHVKPNSAAVMGCNLHGRLRNTISAMSFRDAIEALGDTVPVSLALTSEDENIRLAAAREINKLSGRYERAATVSDMAALMGAMSMPNQASNTGTSDDEFVDELAETVDLTRPGDAS